MALSSKTNGSLYINSVSRFYFIFQRLQSLILASLYTSREPVCPCDCKVPHLPRPRQDDRICSYDGSRRRSNPYLSRPYSGDEGPEHWSCRLGIYPRGEESCQGACFREWKHTVQGRRGPVYGGDRLRWGDDCRRQLVQPCYFYAARTPSRPSAYNGARPPIPRYCGSA